MNSLAIVVLALFGGHGKTPAAPAPPWQMKAQPGYFGPEVMRGALLRAGFASPAIDAVVASAQESWFADHKWSPARGFEPVSAEAAVRSCLTMGRRSARDTFAGVLSVLKSQRDVTVRAVRAEKYDEAFRSVGLQLRTLVAFFAHSNFAALSLEERRSLHKALKDLSGTPPESLRIASSGQSEYPLAFHDKSTPTSSPDAEAVTNTISGYELSKSAAYAASDALIEELRAYFDKDGMGQRWQSWKTHRWGMAPSQSLFAEPAIRRGARDAAFAWVLVGPGEKLQLRNPFDTALSFQVLDTQDVGKVEPGEVADIPKDAYRLMITTEPLGTLIVVVPHTSNRKEFAGPSVSAFRVGELGSEELPVFGSGTSALVWVEGSAGPGQEFGLRYVGGRGVESVAGAAVLLAVVDAAGRVRESLVQFQGADVSNEVAEAQIVVVDSSGQALAAKPVPTYFAGVRMALSPESGEPGSKATIRLDVTAYRKAIAAERALVGHGDWRLALDYVDSGGVQGPATIPFPESGVVEFEVVRGSMPGLFSVSVKPVPHSEIESESTCSGGWVSIRGARSSLSPHPRKSLPGCPFCGGLPFELGGAKPTTCPGGSFFDSRRGHVFVGAHGWGSQRTCRICR